MGKYNMIIYYLTDNTDSGVLFCHMYHALK